MPKLDWLLSRKKMELGGGEGSVFGLYSLYLTTAEKRNKLMTLPPFLVLIISTSRKTLKILLKKQMGKKWLENR